MILSIFSFTGLCTPHNHDDSEGYENYLYNNERIPFRPMPSQLERLEHEQKRLENTKKYTEQIQIKDNSVTGNRGTTFAKYQNTNIKYSVEENIYS